MKQYPTLSCEYPPGRTQIETGSSKSPLEVARRKVKTKYQRRLDLRLEAAADEDEEDKEKKEEEVLEDDGRHEVLGHGVATPIPAYPSLPSTAFYV